MVVVYDTELNSKQKEKCRELLKSDLHKTYQEIKKFMPSSLDNYDQRSTLWINKYETVRLSEWADVCPTIKDNSKWIDDTTITSYLKLLSKFKHNIYVDASIATVIATTDSSKDKTPFRNVLFENINNSDQPMTSENNRFYNNRHFWPVCIKETHYILVVVFIGRNMPSQVTIYDSQNRGEKYTKNAERIRNYYAQKLRNLFEDEDEIPITVRNSAIENNAGKNCGIYVMMRAAQLMEATPQLLYEDFRTRAAYELLANEIMPAEPDATYAQSLNHLLRKMYESLNKRCPVKGEKLGKSHAHELIDMAADLDEQFGSFSNFFVTTNRIREIAKIIDESFQKQSSSSSATSDTKRKIEPEVPHKVSQTFCSPSSVAKRPRYSDQQPSRKIGEKRFSKATENHFANVAKIIGSDFDDPEICEILNREKAKMDKGKPIPDETWEPMDSDDKQRAKEKLWRKLCREGEAEGEFPGKFNGKQKEWLTYNTYRDGLSGDERAEPTEGPPFRRNEPLECRLCKTRITSYNNAITHIIHHNVPRCLQKRVNESNRPHPRVNLKALKRRPVIACMYLQKAPKSPGQVTKESYDSSSDESPKKLNKSFAQTPSAKATKVKLESFKSLEEIRKAKEKQEAHAKKLKEIKEKEEEVRKLEETKTALLRKREDEKRLRNQLFGDDPMSDDEDDDEDDSPTSSADNTKSSINTNQSKEQPDDPIDDSQIINDSVATDQVQELKDANSDSKICCANEEFTVNVQKEAVASQQAEQPPIGQTEVVITSYPCEQENSLLVNKTFEFSDPTLEAVAQELAQIPFEEINQGEQEP